MKEALFFIVESEVEVEKREEQFKLDAKIINEERDKFTSQVKNKIDNIKAKELELMNKLKSNT